MAESPSLSGSDFAQYASRVGRRLWRSAYGVDLLFVAVAVWVLNRADPRMPPPLFGRWAYTSGDDCIVGLVLGLLPVGAASLRLAGAVLSQKKRALIVLVILSAELLAFSITLPARSRSREVGNRKLCMDRLGQIGDALRGYAGAHDGRLPDGFADLLASGDAAPDLFICPSTNDKVADGDTPEALLADFARPDHCSYLYHGGSDMDSLPASYVLAHDVTTNHNEDGIQVLYGDGTVEWVPKHSVEWVLRGLTAGDGSAQAVPQTQRSQK
jgi:hypothetical protein